MQVWYEHVADCDHCVKFFSCQAYLFRSAKERGIKLTKDQKKLIPSSLAKVIFQLV